MKRRKFIRWRVLILALVMCLELAGPTLALATNPVGAGELGDGGQVREPGGSNSLINMDLSNSASRIFKQEEEIETSIKLKWLDPKAEILDAELELSFAGAEAIASFNSYSDTKNIGNFISQVDLDTFSQKLTYKFKKVQSGTELDIKVGSMATGFAKKGDAYYISAIFSYTRASDGERVRVGGTSSPIEIRYETGDGSNLIDVKNPSSLKWTFATEHFKGQAGQNRTSWQQFKNPEKQSFKNLEIKYIYDNKASKEQLTLYGGRGENNHRRPSAGRFENTEVNLAPSLEESRDQDGRPIELVKFGAVNGNIYSWIRIFGEMRTKSTDVAGTSYGATIEFYEDGHLLKTTQVSITVDPINYSLSYEPELVNDKVLGLEGVFAYDFNYAAKGPRGLGAIKNGKVSIDLPKGLYLDSVHHGVVYYDYGKNVVDNVKYYTKDPEGNYIEKKLKKKTAKEGSQEYITRVVDDSNQPKRERVDRVEINLKDIDDVSFYTPARLMLYKEDLSTPGGNPILDNSFEIKSRLTGDLPKIVGGEYVKIDGQIQYETYNSGERISKHTSKGLAQENEIALYNTLYDIQVRPNNIGGQLDQVLDKDFKNKDEIRTRQSFAVGRGRVENPYFFAVVPKGTKLVQVEQNSIESPYTNNPEYTYIPSLGSKTNEKQKLAEPKILPFGDDYDLIIQASETSLESKVGYEIMHVINKFQLHNPISKDYEFQLGVGFDDSKSQATLTGNKSNNTWKYSEMEMPDDLGAILEKELGFRSSKYYGKKAKLVVQDNNLILPTIKYKNEEDSQWQTADANNIAVAVVPGKKVNFQIELQNLGTNILEKFELINILPHLGDELAGGQSRGSMFNLASDNTKPVVKINNKTTNAGISTANSYKPKRFDLNAQDLSGADWEAGGALPSQIKSLKIDLPSGTSLRPGDTLSLSYTLNVPIDAPRPSSSQVGDEQVANNNITYRYELKNTGKKAAESVIAKMITSQAEKNGEIGGQVYMDTNKNSIMDQGELGAANIIFILYKKDGAGDFVAVPGMTTESGHTAGLSKFGFSNLDYGSYKIKLEIPPSHIGVSLPDSYRDGDFIKDQDGRSEFTINDSGVNTNKIDKISIPLHSETVLSGALSFIENRQDPTEITIVDKDKYIENIYMELYEGSQLVDTTKTNAQGEYEFKKVNAQVTGEKNYRIKLKFASDKFIVHPSAVAQLDVNIKPSDRKLINLSITETGRPSISLAGNKEANSRRYENVKLNIIENETDHSVNYYLLVDGAKKSETTVAGLAEIDITDSINAAISGGAKEILVKAKVGDDAGNQVELSQEASRAIIKPIEQRRKINAASFSESNIGQSTTEASIREMIHGQINYADPDPIYLRKDEIDLVGIPNLDSSLENRTYTITIKEKASTPTKPYLRAQDKSVIFTVVPSLSLGENSFTVSSKLSGEALTSQVEDKIAIRFPASLDYEILYEDGLLDHIGQDLNHRISKEYTNNKLVYRTPANEEKFVNFKVRVEGSTSENQDNALEANSIKVKKGAVLTRPYFAAAIGLKVKIAGSYIKPNINNLIIKSLVDGEIGGEKPAGDLSFNLAQDLNLSYQGLEDLAKNISISIAPQDKYEHYSLEAQDVTVEPATYTKTQIAQLIGLVVKDKGQPIAYDLADVKFYDDMDPVADFGELLSQEGTRHLQLSYEPEGVKGINASVSIKVESSGKTDGKNNKRLELNKELLQVEKDLIKTRADLIGRLKEDLGLELYKDNSPSSLDDSKLRIYQGDQDLTDLKLEGEKSNLEAYFGQIKEEETLTLVYEGILKDFKVSISDNGSNRDGFELSVNKKVRIPRHISFTKTQLVNTLGVKLRKDLVEQSFSLDEIQFNKMDGGTIGDLLVEPIEFTDPSSKIRTYYSPRLLARRSLVEIVQDGSLDGLRLEALDNLEITADNYTKEEALRMLEVKLMDGDLEQAYDLDDIKFYRGLPEVQIENILSTPAEASQELRISYEKLEDGVQTGGIAANISLRVVANDPGIGGKANRLEANNISSTTGRIKTKEDLVEASNLQVYLDGNLKEGDLGDKISFYDGSIPLVATSLESYFNEIKSGEDLILVYRDGQLSMGKTIKVSLTKEDMETIIQARSFNLVKSNYDASNIFDFLEFKRLSKFKMLVDGQDYSPREDELIFSLNFVEELEAIRSLRTELKVLAQAIREINSQLELEDRLEVKNNAEIDSLDFNQLDSLKLQLEADLGSQKSKLEFKLQGQVKALGQELLGQDSGAEVRTDGEIEAMNLEELRAEKARLEGIIQLNSLDIIDEVEEEPASAEEAEEAEELAGEAGRQESQDPADLGTEEVEKVEEVEAQEAGAGEEVEDPVGEDLATTYRIQEAVSLARLGNPVGMLLSLADIQAEDFQEISDLQKLRPGSYDLRIKHKDFGEARLIRVRVHENGDLVPIPEDQASYEISVNNLSFVEGRASLDQLIDLYLLDDNYERLGDKIGWNQLDSGLEKSLEIKLAQDDFTNLESFRDKLNQLSGPSSHTANIWLEVKNKKGMILGSKETSFTISVNPRPSTPSTGGGSGGGGSRPDQGARGPKLPRDNQVIEPQVVEYELNKVDHIAYLTGYSDGTVRPEGNLTREEAAMVFYRLLDPDFKASVATKEHSFKDVEAGKWSEQAIATLAKAGMITGYKDGSFKPTKELTRAELASILAKLTDVKAIDSQFTDVINHWAEHYINTAQANGWIQGYSDGSFRPNNLVTRSEFASMVNKYLERSVVKENILEDIKIFKDLKDGSWYYEDMVEATNGHKYEIKDKLEIWTELIK